MQNEYDFIQTINSSQLIDEITIAGLPAPDSILTNDSSVQIFYVLALTTDQQTALITVVTNHVADPNYVTVANQAQITKLLGYLNNSNSTIANTARAVIVSNLAPHLPPAVLANINSAIYSIVGS